MTATGKRMKAAGEEARMDLIGVPYVPDVDLEAALAGLKKRRKDVAAYFEIMKAAGDPNRPEFQREYDAFYRVRRDEAWRREYFRLMDLYARRGNVSFGEILFRLHQATGQVEASFASKMMATLNENMPIWDAKVLGALHLRLAGKGADERLSNAVVLYDRICAWYREFLGTDEAKEMLRRFDEGFPEFQSMSPTKKVDFLLWAG